MHSGSQASTKDMSLLFSSNFKHFEGQNSIDLMGSNLQNHLHLQNHQQPQQQQKMNSGLMRYQSAPSSFFANIFSTDDFEEFLNPRSSSPETERIFGRFISSGGQPGASPSPDFSELQQKSAAINHQTQFMPSTKGENEVVQQRNDYTSGSQTVYQTQSQPPIPNHSSPAPTSAMGSTYQAATSMTMDGLPHMKVGGGGNSNLIRHSSSPAGLFADINVENGFAVMRGMGNFRAGSGSEAETSPSTSRLKSQANFTSGPSSSSGLMTQMSESMGASFSEVRGSDEYVTGFPIGSWDDSTIISETFAGLKRSREDDSKTFSGLKVSDTQSGGTGNRPPGLLAHHLSLPKTSAEMAVVAEMAAVENFLQFQDSVPCKIRAKRGCATHPRSIAERVRRTRISERMRKLQELVPNMDKQTNTSDMLDLAVEYIKDLQKQVKTLADNRSKCTCSNKQKS